MRKIIYFFSLMCVLSVCAFAQVVDGIKANLAMGEVTAINAADNKLSLKTKDGAIDAILSSKTIYKRIPPENPTLSAAVASTLAELGVGDKVLVTGLVADDKKTMPAKGVYLMTKSDISKKQTAEQEKWKTRSVSGKVKTINAATKEITLTVPSFAGERLITLNPIEKAVYRRYAENSNDFNEAVKSTFEDIKVGDQIKAVGEKSTDGLKVSAEEFITGSFRQIAGKIIAIDVAKNEITINDATANKPTPLIIVIKDSVQIKKFPAEMAASMAMRAGGGMPAGGMVRPPNTGGQTGGQPMSGGQPGGQMPSAGGGQGRGAGGSLDGMVERLPKITISELKVGDTIGTLTNSTKNRVMAINTVLSGVEAFLTAPQIPGAGGRGGQGGQGGGSGFSIPGLDGGFGNP